MKSVFSVALIAAPWKKSSPCPDVAVAMVVLAILVPFAQIICRKILTCPDRVPQDKPVLNGDENAQNEPEISEPENSQTAAQPQVPPPINPKRSCSAMPYMPDQTGVWAILLALLLGFVAVVRRRKS